MTIDYCDITLHYVCAPNKTKKGRITFGHAQYLPLGVVRHVKNCIFFFVKLEVKVSQWYYWDILLITNVSGYVTRRP